ncbi:MAG: RNA methyltransferase [Planctomycetes bacterium]|nr:RNA methyltransferase [Planctomycetota bacterium]
MKRVVLVRPTGPRNVGGVMRAVANFGPAELWLVRPERPSMLIHPDFDQMSHGVENVRERIRVVDSLDEALSECNLTIGFTARPRGERWRADWREMVEETRPTALAEDQRLALVFGSEWNGLTDDELDRCQHASRLPTAEEHTSLNLAVAASIVLYTLFEGRGSYRHEGGARMLSFEERAFLKQHLIAVLAHKVARGDATVRDVEASIERVFSRAPLESRDARAWHKLMRALGSDLEPSDFDLQPNQKGERRDGALERNRKKREPGSER